MKTLRESKALQGMVAVVVMALAGGPASAVNMTVYVSNPYQVSQGSVVSMGHAVSAWTDFNRLMAGGTYVASCNHPDMSPMSGQRTESTSALLGGLRMTVTIPTTMPAYIGMAGFSSLPRGTVVNCTYVWTAKASEGGYKIGSGGIGIGIGDGEKSLGDTKPFTMRVRSATDEDENSTCIP